MSKRLFPKPVWKEACGAAQKDKRLNLRPGSKRSCRKHVLNRHGWYYYFDFKPKVSTVFQHNKETREVKTAKGKF